MNSLLIGLGGAIGAICRFYVGLVVSQKTKSSFPLGTLLINITGSFLLGLLFHLQLSDWAMWLFGIGFCGAFTTFSTFGNETVQLIVADKLKLAGLYVGGSLLLSFLAAWIGFIIW